MTVAYSTTNPPPSRDRFLRLPEVKHLTGLGRTSIYEAVRRRGFPPPVKLGRASAWSQAEVLVWIEAAKASRDAA